MESWVRQMKSVDKHIPGREDSIQVGLEVDMTAVVMNWEKAGSEWAKRSEIQSEGGEAGMGQVLQVY